MFDLFEEVGKNKIQINEKIYVFLKFVEYFGRIKIFRKTFQLEEFLN